MRRLGVLALVVIAVVVANAPAAAASPAVGCPRGKLVVDSALKAVNIADLGADGHVWALDRYRSHIHIWKTSRTGFCVRVEDAGRFSSFAGVSPEGTGTISAGVSGAFVGVLIFRIKGTFAPTVPTHGFVGTFDGQCQPDGTCLGTEPHVSALYFSKVTGFSPGPYLAAYHAPGHGTWIQSSKGDLGDITG